MHIVYTLTEFLGGKSKTIKKLCEKNGMTLETIEATTCPYGNFNQHLNESANCELGDDCVYSGKPVKA